MSRERARLREQRRLEREAVVAAAARKRLRRERRRAVLRRLLPRRRRRHVGRLFARRTRAERAAITMAVLFALGFVWYNLDSLPARIGGTLLILTTAPMLVVLAFDRRI